MPELKFHPLADLFPPMGGEEFDALVADIKTNGLHHPIVLFEGKILDGRNRYRTCLVAGWEPATRNCDHHVGDPASYVISQNIHRRHLTAKQKRELVAKLLKAQPGKSDRQIAKAAKVSPSTVGTVRTKMEAKGDVSKLDTREDTKGREQPAKKPPAKVPTRVSKPAPHQPAHISQEVGEQVGSIAAKLVKLDASLARELARILLQPGVPTRLWHDITALLDDSGSAGGGTDPGTPAKATNALGKQLSPQFDPNWKRKTKLTPIARLRASQKNLRMTDAAATGIEAEGKENDPEVSAEAMKAKLAALDDSSGAGPMPEILRRDRVQS